MKKQKIIVVALLVPAARALAGCSFLDGLKLFKGEEETPPDEVTVEQELDLTASDPAPNGNRNESTEQAPAPSAETSARRVTLYFAASDGSGLKTEERDIPQQPGIARATVNELIAGPQTAGLDPTLPASAIVEGMTVRDGLCTVDFSSELTEHLPSGEQARLLAVSSLVNTLTQFDTVEKVRILVDGEPVAGSVAGVDLAAALAPADL